MDETLTVKRMLGLFFLLALIGAVYGTVRWATSPTTLPIQRVRIEGQFLHLTTEDLQKVVAPYAVGGFFTVDVEAVKRAAEQLTWVERVAVRRIWPDTLTVRVDEHLPLARWGDGEVLSTRGKLFSPAKESIPKGLPQFRGQPGLEQAMVERYRAIGEVLKPLGLTIAALTVDERRAWRMELGNNFELILGHAEVDRRLERFARSYPGSLAPKAEEIARVDMRYPNGFAVSWRHGGGEEHKG